MVLPNLYSPVSNLPNVYSFYRSLLFDLQSACFSVSLKLKAQSLKLSPPPFCLSAPFSLHAAAALHDFLFLKRTCLFPVTVQIYFYPFGGLKFQCFIVWKLLPSFSLFSARLFWDCKGTNLFYLCKFYFFVFQFAFSENIPLPYLRAAKVGRFMAPSNTCLIIFENSL
jgi:hypothetical protein